MGKSIPFLPDISGFTKFVQSTEVERSQHVIAELLGVLIAANTQKLKLGEIEGDALFLQGGRSAIPRKTVGSNCDHVYCFLQSFKAIGNKPNMPM